MRFLSVLTVACLLSGVFTNHPTSVMMATPASKAVKKETKEISKHSKESVDPANEKKQGVQNSSAENPKTSASSTVDYGKIIEQQLSDFLERNLFKNIAALPLKPIATIAISSLQDGLKKAFFIGDKIYPGFSTLAQLFISGYLGGADCPGVDPNAPCYVLLFPHPSEIVSPLICFKATPESLIVKNFQSESNKAGDWQLISPTTITEEAYNIWMAAPKTLFSKFKDFSIVTALFEPTTEHDRNPLSVEIDVESLSAFMPLPVLKLAYDTYVKKDFEKIVYALDTDEEKLTISVRSHVKPQTPWSIFCKAVNARKKTFRSLNFPSEVDTESVFCWNPSASKNLLNALSTYAKEAEWKAEPIAHQAYRWGQLLYPLLNSYLDFAETASVGNGQFYNFTSGRIDGFGIEELKPSVTDRVLVAFLKSFIEMCERQLETAKREGVLGSECPGGCTFEEKVLTYKGCDIHKCALRIRGCNSGEHGGSAELTLFSGLCKGYLLYASSPENAKRLLDWMQVSKTFPYISHSDAVALSRIAWERVKDGKVCPGKGVFEVFRNTELEPEVFVTNVGIPLPFIEFVGTLFFGNAGLKNAEDEGKAEKTTDNGAINPQPDVSEPTNERRADKDASDKTVSDQKPTASAETL